MKDFTYKIILTIFLLMIPFSSVLSQWYVSYTFNPSQSLQVIRFYNENTGYTTAPIYNSSTYNIHKTTNAGLNWTDQSSGYTGMRFMSMWCVSADTVYIGGNNGIIIKTVNGGQNWVTLASNDTIQVWGMQFVNSNTGYAAGSWGHILKTTNAGASWTINYVVPTQNLLSYIFFTNENTGYISGSAIILKTTNAGTSWSPLSAAFQNFEDVNQIQFIDDQTGYGVSSAYRFFKTTNAGANWTISTVGSSTLMAEYFVNVNTGYACGWNGTIMYTTDAGNNWSAQASGLTEILTSIYFTTAQTGYIATWYSKVLKTTNGGITFIQKTGSEVPQKYSLSDNYPNPFNPSTKIKFQIPANGEKNMFHVKLKICDIRGKEVAEPVNEDLQPGSYEVTFNANSFSSGVYFYTLSSNNFTETKKMVLLR
jgi:photosystem II stability/assembly factor-like uncharacterized protein